MGKSLNKPFASVFGLLFLIIVLFTISQTVNSVTPNTLADNLAMTQTATIPQTSEEEDGFSEENINRSSIVLKLNNDLKDFSAQVLRLDKTKASAQLKLAKNLALERREVLAQLAKEDPTLALSAIFPSSDLFQLSKDLSRETEVKENFTGEVTVSHQHDFSSQNQTTFSVTLKQGGQEIPLYLDQSFYPESGATIAFSGYELGGGILVDTQMGGLQVTNPPPAPDSVGEQKLLVFLTNFSDSAPPPFIQTEVENRIFNSQIQAFYQEQSYDQVFLSGTVVDWHTLPRNGNLANGFCQWPTITTGFGVPAEIGSIIVNEGINLAEYDRMLILADHPCMTGGFNQGVGKTALNLNGTTYQISISYVGSLQEFNTTVYSHSFPWTKLDRIFAHELGHGLGLQHARGLNCFNEMFALGGCQVVEYGNMFDLMGTEKYALHFNAFTKEKLGWLSEEDVLTIAESGRYTLNPLEGQTGIRLAKVKTNDGSFTPFALETRRAIGFDSSLNNPEVSNNQNGLFVNSLVSPSNPASTRLVDMIPASLDWDDDVAQSALISTDTQNLLTVPGYGVQLGPIVSTSPDSTTFDVTVEPLTCVNNEPLNQIIVSPPFHPGAQSYMTVKMDNMDSIACGASPLIIVPTLPVGWTYDLQAPFGVNLDSGEYAIFGITISVPTGTPTGSYPLDIAVQNPNSGMSTVRNLTVNVDYPVHINILSANAGSAESPVTISGSNFAVNGMNFVTFSNSQFYDFIGANPTNNPNSLSFEVPAYPPGSYQITVSTLGGTSNPLNFTITN